MVKGDVDLELDPVPARHGWKAVAALAKDLNDEKWMYRSTGEIGFTDYLQGNFDSAFAKVFGSLAQAKTHLNQTPRGYWNRASASQRREA